MAINRPIIITDPNGLRWQSRVGIYILDEKGSYSYMLESCTYHHHSITILQKQCINLYIYYLNKKSFSKLYTDRIYNDEMCQFQWQPPPAILWRQIWIPVTIYFHQSSGSLTASFRKDCSGSQAAIVTRQFWVLSSHFQLNGNSFKPQASNFHQI